MPLQRVYVQDEATGALSQLPDDLRRAVARFAAKGSQLVRGAMVEEIRARQRAGTGFLSNSVVGAVEPGGFAVWPTADYALWADQPTRPHVIRPVRAKALAFAAGGGQRSRTRGGLVRTRYRTQAGGAAYGPPVFAALVRHPGTRGLRYVDGTVSRVREPLRGLLEAEVDRAAREAGQA